MCEDGLSAECEIDICPVKTLRGPSFRPHIALSNLSVSSIARRRVDDVLQTVDATLKKPLEVLDDQVLHSPGPQR